MYCPLSPIPSLRTGNAFRHVYQRGRYTAGPLFVLYMKAHGEAESPDTPRLGLSVSKKVGNAVTRNRVKRLVKESCRLRTLAPGYDYVVVARPAAGALPRTGAFAQVDRALGDLLKRMKAK